MIRQLLDAGVHFGHQTKRWNPKMKPFIFGSRAGIYIIDLEQTERCLQAACEFLEALAARGELVLFVGTKRQARPLLEEAAARTQMPYVTTRWLGGTLTNFRTIKRNLDRLRELRGRKERGELAQHSKKEAKRLEKQLVRLEEHFAGLVELNKLPGCLFVIDTKREGIAVHEANRLNLPVVAVCDTNVDPELVTHPIPGNDDAIRSIKLIVSLIAERIMAGRARFAVSQPAPAQANGASPAKEASREPAAPTDA
jgi:small subunit ribosomal protein S2